MQITRRAFTGAAAAWLAISAVSAGRVTGADDQPVAGSPVRQEVMTFETEIRKVLRLDYLLYLPTAYGETDEHWPLVLYLHGSGDLGADPELLRRHGPARRVEGGKAFPFILVTPQCPAGNTWATQLEALAALLDEIVGAYRVDPNRIYVTGMSLGGAGTWSLAADQPHRFAAIAPVCGPTDPRKAEFIKHLPVWVFHGAKDDAVPIEESERMVEALKAAGAEPRFTVYPEAGHDSWTETYDNEELYKWLLGQRRAHRTPGSTSDPSH